MNALLNQIVEENIKFTSVGKVASYIPELSKANKNKLGITVTHINGDVYSAGDADELFTIQSISKAAMFLLALEDQGYENLKKKISILPSIRGFNSILELEIDNEQKPLNPMINAGAIATLSMIKDSKVERIMDFMATLMNSQLTIDYDVFLSEKKTACKNRALAYNMKSLGIIDDDVEELLDIYFKVCSVKVTSRDISHFAAIIANNGLSLKQDRRIISQDNCKILKVVMANCGMYDGSAEFALTVGMPAKSGVSGGIMAIAKDAMGIGIFGPALDERGNSIAGIKVLKALSDKFSLNMY